MKQRVIALTVSGVLFALMSTSVIETSRAQVSGSDLLSDIMSKTNRIPLELYPPGYIDFTVLGSQVLSSSSEFAQSFVTSTDGSRPKFIDIVTYGLTIPNSGLTGYSGPYGTVTVQLLDSKNAQVTFASLRNGANIYLFVMVVPWL